MTATICAVTDGWSRAEENATVGGDVHLVPAGRLVPVTFAPAVALSIVTTTSEARHVGSFAVFPNASIISNTVPVHVADTHVPPPRVTLGLPLYGPLLPEFVTVNTGAAPLRVATASAARGFGALTVTAGTEV